MLIPLHVVRVRLRLISLLLIVALGFPQLGTSRETALSLTIQASTTKSTLLSIHFSHASTGLGGGGWWNDSQDR